MTLADLIQKCADKISGVANTGKVYNRLRLVRDEASFRLIYRDDSVNPPRVRAWVITREATTGTAEKVHSDKDVHTIVMRGYYGFVDAEGDTDFQNSIEDIRAAFRADRQLGRTVFECKPVQVKQAVTGMICGVLVHYAELSMQVTIFPIPY